MCLPNCSSDFAFSCCPGTRFLFFLVAGKMASWWIFSPLVLSGFLLSGDFKSLEDSTSTKNAGTPASLDDRKGKAAAEGNNGSSQLLPQEKQDPGKKQTKMPPALPTASHLQEAATVFPMEIMTKIAPKGSPKNALPETKSKTEPKHHPLEMTKPWSWLVEVTSNPAQVSLSTVTSEQDFGAAGPVSKSLHSSLKKATPSSAFLDDPATTSSHNLIDDLGFSTATQKHTPKDLESKIRLPLITATSATPQHLDEILSTSQTLLEDTEFSVATQKHSWDTGRPGLNPRAKPLLATATSEPLKTQKWLDEMGSTSLASSARSPRRNLGVTTSGSSAPTRGKPPPADDTSPLIGKCLLAILLLALVAAIFIVCSGVLAIMLCRQKRAYRLGQTNHTEMVCISSLLSAEREEEEEERRRREPKVKRVQLLGETGSETEADNLTLNSFLPDH